MANTTDYYRPRDEYYCQVAHNRSSLHCADAFRVPADTSCACEPSSRHDCSLHPLAIPYAHRGNNSSNRSSSSRPRSLRLNCITANVRNLDASNSTSTVEGLLVCSKIPRLEKSLYEVYGHIIGLQETRVKSSCKRTASKYIIIFSSSQGQFFPRLPVLGFQFSQASRAVALPCFS